VGFIGLGNMGSLMCKNLMQAGHKLIVYDLNQSAVQNLISQGATAASSPKQLASSTGISTIITMLPSSPHVKKVYTGEDGILHGIQGKIEFIVD